MICSWVCKRRDQVLVKEGMRNPHCGWRQWGMSFEQMRWEKREKISDNFNGLARNKGLRETWRGRMDWTRIYAWYIESEWGLKTDWGLVCVETVECRYMNYSNKQATLFAYLSHYLSLSLSYEILHSHDSRLLRHHQYMHKWVIIWCKWMQASESRAQGIGSDFLLTQVIIKECVGLNARNEKPN